MTDLASTMFLTLVAIPCVALVLNVAQRSIDFGHDNAGAASSTARPSAMSR
jgi:hypothetical protein